MREYAKISTSIWNSQKFGGIDYTEAKLFYFYLHTSPHSNAVGCYVLKIGYAMEDLNWTDQQCRNALERLCEAGMIGFDNVERLVRIVGFLKNDPFTNPNQAIGAVRQAVNLPDCEEKRLCLIDLKQQKHVKAELLENALQSLSQPFATPDLNQTLTKPDQTRPEKKDSLAISAKSPDCKIPDPEQFDLEPEGPPPPDPVDGCFDAFNEVAGRAGWPVVQARTEPRRKALKARCKEIGGPENWIAQIERAARSPFLTGQTTKPFKASFDFLANKTNFVKLIEGNYDNRDQENGGGQPGAMAREANAGYGRSDDSIATIVARRNRVD